MEPDRVVRPGRTDGFVPDGLAGLEVHLVHELAERLLDLVAVDAGVGAAIEGMRSGRRSLVRGDCSQLAQELAQFSGQRDAVEVGVAVRCGPGDPAPHRPRVRVLVARHPGSDRDGHIDAEVPCHDGEAQILLDNARDVPLSARQADRQLLTEPEGAVVVALLEHGCHLELRPVRQLVPDQQAYGLAAYLHARESPVPTAAGHSRFDRVPPAHLASSSLSGQAAAATHVRCERGARPPADR